MSENEPNADFAEAFGAEGGVSTRETMQGEVAFELDGRFYRICQFDQQ